jgi:hypothetical protein
MGVGPGVLSLYTMMRRDGLLCAGARIIELGAQVLVCQGNQQAVLNLFEAFGVPPPGLPELKKLAEGSSARALFEWLGMEYWCVDASGEHGALKWDLNFDECAPEHRGLYQFVTNHGTTEHLLNQLNAFKMIHDLAARGGLIMHALPFLSYLDHGYFNYQPNLFIDLARANGYELLGMWINIDPKFSHFIPWERGLEKHIQSGVSDSLLLVLFRKSIDEEFSVPFQAVYEHLVPESVLQRYRYVVDGQAVSGRRGLFLSIEDTLLRYYALKENEDTHHSEQFLGKISGRSLLFEVLRRVFRRLSMVFRGRPF